MTAGTRRKPIEDQILGQAIDQLNLDRIQQSVEAQLRQDAALVEAMAHVQRIRDFVGTPQHILGSEATKHGEIAEVVEVGIRNARSALQNEVPTATMEGIGRTSPVDYLIDGVDYQSKFINGARNGLQHVLDHTAKYPDFAPGGGKYHIPADQFDLISRLLRGEQVEGLSEKSVRALLRKVEEIELSTGETFGTLVEPSISGYGEVQQGVIHDTLDKHEEQLEQRHEEIKEEIGRQYEASLSDMARSAAIAGGMSGLIGVGVTFYRKSKEGRNVFKGELTGKDWQDVGLAGAKGFATGAATGAAIYAMTNYAGLAAPLAAAVASATKGVASLGARFHRGEIDGDAFLEAGLVVCSESAIVTLATVAGQTLIPVPILGAILGSIAGKTLSQLAVHLSEADRRKLEARTQEFLQGLAESHRQLVEEINRRFDALDDLTRIAFDSGLNQGLFLASSVKLAIAYEVEPELILRTHCDVDAFMMA